MFISAIKKIRMSFAFCRKICIFALNHIPVKRLTVFAFMLYILGNPCSAGAQGTMRDREGNNYRTLVIANKVWMAENLNVSHYRNGDAIPEAKTSADWDRYCESKTGCWCYYDFSALNGRKYGKLYNWFAVNDARGLAPKGWHIPQDVEWLVFTNIPKEGDRPGRGMKSNSGWGTGNEDCSGSNDTGFDGLPGGSREVGDFEGIRIIGHWWCSTESEVNFARIRSLACNSDDLWLHTSLKQCGNSIRCVKD